ncbi:MAG: DUF2141 domain-containing protein [Bacteroidota bacterium]
MKFLLVFSLMSSIFVPDVPQQTTEAEIQLMVHNIRSAKGKILVGVYDKAESFTDDPQYSLEFSKENFRDGMVTCRFSLPIGTYAFSLLDDENEDYEMNYNLFGIPKEGYGFSKDAKVKLLSPPAFDDCKLQLSLGMNALKVRARYF